MQPVFENKTVLTEDLYMSGIKEYYKIGHRFSRSLAVAYAVVMLGFAGIFLYDLNKSIIVKNFVLYRFC